MIICRNVKGYQSNNQGGTTKKYIYMQPSATIKTKLFIILTETSQTLIMFLNKKYVQVHIQKNTYIIIPNKIFLRVL